MNRQISAKRQRRPQGALSIGRLTPPGNEQRRGRPSPPAHGPKEHDDYDRLTSYYSSRDGSTWGHYIAHRLEPRRHMVASTVKENDISLRKSNASKGHLPILIDSGTSGTVAGRPWINSWRGNLPTPLSPSPRIYRFGDR